MLSITRKPGQSIRLGDNIKVTVTEVRGRQIRLTIDAPREIGVFREELYQQLLEENARAARVVKERLDQLL